jgi:sec-independent protein translocase protein TatC
MAAGLVVASPFLVWQIWLFIAPALLPKEKRYVLPVFPVILFLFAAGAAFGYFLVLPVSLGFLLNFGSELISNQIRLDRAVSFVVNICLACGIVFQMPVVVFLLSKVGLITSVFLKRKRKFMIIVIFILAAALTPTPDPFTMMLVAIPMLLLYEISIIVAGMTRATRKSELIES